MGIRVVLAALNAELRELVETGASLDDVAQSAAREARRADPEAWAIEVGKVGRDLVAILSAICDHAGGDALLATRTGREVGSDRGDGWPRARYMTPDTVRTIAESLDAGLGGDPIPRPDDDGYVADPRMDTDPRFVRAAQAIESQALDPMSPRDTNELRSLFTAVRNHYRCAAKRGDAMLVCFR